MAIQEFIDYIKEYSAQGYNVEELEKHLIEQGYNKAEVTQAAHTVNSQINKKPSTSIHPIFIGVGILFFLSVASLLFFLVNQPQTDENNETVITYSDIQTDEQSTNNEATQDQREDTLDTDNSSLPTDTQPSPNANQTLTDCGESQYFDTTISLATRQSEESITCFGDAVTSCSYATIKLLPDTTLTTKDCLVNDQEVSYVSSSGAGVFFEVINQIQLDTQQSQVLSEINSQQTNTENEQVSNDPQPLLTKDIFEYGETITGFTFFYYEQSFEPITDMDEYECTITSQSSSGFCEFWFGTITENLTTIEHYYTIEQFESESRAITDLEEDEMTFTFDTEVSFGEQARLYTSSYEKELLKVKINNVIITTSYPQEDAEITQTYISRLLELFE